MATIHLARDGTNLGTFSIEEVREGLRTGRFLATDLAWETGMPDWRPLAQFMAAKDAAAGPVPGPTGAIAVSAGSSGDSSAAGTCSGLPWERREELGFVKAFVDTVVLLLTKPDDAFGMMKREGDLVAPLIFALIGGSAGMIVASLFQLALHSMSFMRDRYDAFFQMGMGMGIVMSIILVPVFLACVSFLWSGIVHLCLMMLGGAKQPFETTFRVICFSTGSTHLLAMIPICGRLIAAVYNIVLQCIGLARAHETDTGKAVMAVLLPAVVCCGGIMSLAILGGFSALSFLSRH